MTYKNKYRLGRKFGGRHLMIGDALAYGRQDMDRVLHEILASDIVHVPSPLTHDL